MNNQVPYQFMPNWQGNPNFPGNWPNGNGQGGCQCRDQLNRIDNRLNHLERQVRRLENRISRLESGFPVPFTANANNEQDSNSYPGNSNMYMM